MFIYYFLSLGKYKTSEIAYTALSKIQIVSYNIYTITSTRSITMTLRLLELRQEHNLTQLQLAGILHISQRSYSHYETGSREIPIELLIKLADYYNTSIDYIVGRI